MRFRDVLRPGPQKIEFELEGTVVAVSVESQPGYIYLASWVWTDGASWRLQYGDDLSSGFGAILWRNDAVVMRRTIPYLEGLSPTAEWLPDKSAKQRFMKVSHVFRWKGRAIYYSSDAGVTIAEFAFKWSWQAMVLLCSADWADMAPVLCADLVTNFIFTTPS